MPEPNRVAKVDDVFLDGALFGGLFFPPEDWAGCVVVFLYRVIEAFLGAAVLDVGVRAVLVLFRLGAEFIVGKRPV